MTKSLVEQVLDYAMSLADDGSVEGTIKIKDQRITADLTMTFSDDEQPFRIRIEPAE